MRQALSCPAWVFLGPQRLLHAGGQPRQAHPRSTRPLRRLPPRPSRRLMRSALSSRWCPARRCLGPQRAGRLPQQIFLPLAIPRHRLPPRTSRLPWLYAVVPGASTSAACEQVTAIGVLPPGATAMPVSVSHEQEADKTSPFEMAISSSAGFLVSSHRRAGRRGM